MTTHCELDSDDAMFPELCGMECTNSFDCMHDGHQALYSCYTDHEAMPSLFNTTVDGICDCNLAYGLKGVDCFDSSAKTVLVACLAMCWVLVAGVQTGRLSMMWGKLNLNPCTSSFWKQPANVALFFNTLSQLSMIGWYLGYSLFAFRVDQQGSMGYFFSSICVPLCGTGTTVATMLIGLMWIDMSSKKLKKKKSNAGKYVAITATFFFVIVFPLYMINGSLGGAASLLFLLGIVPSLLVGGSKIAASLKTSDGSNDLIVSQIKGAAYGMSGGLGMYFISVIIYILVYVRDTPTDNTVDLETLCAYLFIPMAICITLNSVTQYSRFGYRKQLGLTYTSNTVTTGQTETQTNTVLQTKDGPRLQ